MGLQDKKLSLRKAAEVVRVMASHDPVVDELDSLRDALKNGKTEKQVEAFLNEWMQARKKT